MAFTKKRITSLKTLVSSEDVLGLDEIELEGVTEGDNDPDELGLAEALGEGVGLTEALGDSEDELEGLDEGEGEAEGEALVTNPSSMRVCFAEIESTIFRISKFLPNLNDPGVPLSS